MFTWKVETRVIFWCITPSTKIKISDKSKFNTSKRESSSMFIIVNKAGGLQCLQLDFHLTLLVFSMFLAFNYPNKMVTNPMDHIQSWFPFVFRESSRSRSFLNSFFPIQTLLPRKPMSRSPIMRAKCMT